MRGDCDATIGRGAPTAPPEESLGRRVFLRRAGAGAAALGASGLGAMALAACGKGGSSTTDHSSTSTSSTAGSSRPSLPTHSATDGGIVVYLLGVEELLVAFYQHALSSDLFSGSQARDLAEIAQQETLHVAALRGALQSMHLAAPKAATYNIPRADAHGTAVLAYALENIAAAAYLGQLANFQSPALLQLALTIHSVEGRHAAALANITGVSATPDGALAQPEGEQEVLSAIAPFTT